MKKEMLPLDNNLEQEDILLYLSLATNNIGKGKMLDIRKFYVAWADGDNAKTINSALKEGKI